MTTKSPKRRDPRRRRPPLSRRKRIAFTLIAVALPFAALLLLEFGLRAFTSLGGYPPSFLTLGHFDNGDALVTSSGEGSQAFFFRNKELPGTLTASTFREPKPDNTVRVVLVGGSAIKGYPQTSAFAASAFLGDMLGDMWPDRDVEVINLGTTAIASFPVLVLTTEALDYEPDLVVIYAGHNEFFGAYGVASLNTVARSPAMIALQYSLRKLAIVQWIDALIAGSGKSKASSGKMLMEIMAARPYTGPNDPLRKDAARNLRTNITEMVKRCERAGVPAIVCTLPVNERGLAPLGTSKLDALNPADQQHVRDTLERALPMIEVDPESMLEDLRAAVAATPDHARAHWLLARALFAIGAHAEAREQFAKAVDLDPMPWRATELQNDAIRDAAKETGATLCDVRAAFRDASDGGSVGWELMDDHVHLSLRGQALLARTIVGALSAFDGPLHVDRERFEAMAPWEDYAYRLGDSPFERYAVAFRMRKLFDVPFFHDTNAQAIALMDQRLRDLDAQMSPTELRIVRAWQDPKVNFGYSRPVSTLIGVLDMQEGRHADAAHVFLAALNAIPAYSAQSLEFTYLHCRAAQLADPTLSPQDIALAQDAIARGEFMIANSNDAEAPIHRFVGSLQKVLGDHAASIPHLLAARAGFQGQQLLELDQALIHSLLQAGQRDKALELANWGITNAGPLIPAYQAMRAQIESTDPSSEPVPPK